MNCAFFTTAFTLSCLVQKTFLQNQDVTIFDNLNGVVKVAIGVILGKNGNAYMRGTENKRNFENLQPFPCKAPNRSKEKPTSVHKLRPGDIDVIAAMGDSLTVAHGGAARHLLEIAVENRGLAWSIGGQGTWQQLLTLPNILKEFNPNLVGFSKGDGSAIYKDSQFNVAEGGAMSRDMPYMAKVLVKRIKADERVNFTHDWKMVTLMVGNNDQCTDSCHHPDLTSWVEAHRKHLTKTLEYLRDNMPRTIVNISPPPNVNVAFTHHKTSALCTLIHTVGCSCVYGTTKDDQLDRMIQMMRMWHMVEEQVCQDARFKISDEFAVVLQPLFVDADLPERKTPSGVFYDFSLTSPDCVHLSIKGNSKAGLGLWNNILQPVGQKSLDWRNLDTFPCPSESSPYIFTWKNSGNSGNSTQIFL